MTQAETLRSFHGVREDLARFEAAAGMVGSVRALSGGDEADRRVFNLLYNALDTLETCDSGFENIEAALGIKLSILAGYAPQLDACLGCGTYLDEASEPLHFAPDHGGVLCQECRPATADAFPLAPGTLESLRTLIEQPHPSCASTNWTERERPQGSPLPRPRPRSREYAWSAPAWPAPDAGREIPRDPVWAPAVTLPHGPLSTV